MEIKKSKYNSLAEWRKANPNDYNKAYRRKLIEKICKLYGWEYKNSYIKWTEDKCIEEAKKYTNAKEWKSNSRGSLDASRRLNCYSDCIKHMVGIRKPTGYWSAEKCLDECSKYTKIKEWKDGCVSSFNASKRLGIYTQCTKHMR